MRLLLAAAFLVATMSRAQDAPRSMDDLWREATLWEVGSNTEKVPAARKALIARGAETLAWLVPAKLDTKDTLVTRALSVIVTGIGATASQPLRDALTSDIANVRRNAADLLGQLGDASSAPAIARLLEDTETRGGALTALGALKSRESVPAIAALLARTDGVKERERVLAASTLGGIGGDDAQAALQRTLSDERAQVRWAAQLALEKIAAAAPLVPLTLSRANGPARLHAIAALGNIGDVSAAPILLPLLRDSVPQVRGFAAEALGRLKRAEDASALRDALTRETDAFARGKMESALVLLAPR